MAMASTKVVCGTKCTWWDTIDKVGRTEGKISLPCCPHCKGMLIFYPDEDAWWDAVSNAQERWGKSLDEHKEMILWGRGHCFPNQRVLQNAWDNRMRGDLDVWCRSNWNRVPEEDRSACIEHLKNVLGPENVTRFSEQYARGERIGADIPGFHFGGGMAVRNALRKVLLDDRLPEVTQRDGSKSQNWDDFYLGTLEELCERELGN